MKKRKNVLWSLLIALNFICHLSIISASAVQKEKITLSNFPDYSGEAYVELNGNVPDFSKSELTEKAFEEYSELDDLGRSGVAFANVCTDTMPTEERSEIGILSRQPKLHEIVPVSVSAELTEIGAEAALPKKAFFSDDPKSAEKIIIRKDGIEIEMPCDPDENIITAMLR